MPTENKPLTIADLNCDNCTNTECNWSLKWKSTWHSDVYYFIGKNGCIKHPLALQVLAKPVVEELERCKKQEVLLPDDTPESVFEMANDYAIKLLKGEVVIP